MSQFLETIKCKNGELFNLEFHQDRFNRVRKKYFGFSNKIHLDEQIEIPENTKKGLFRCRIVYSAKIEKIEFIPHQYKKVKSLKLVQSEKINYQYKYLDRNVLNELFEKRGDCDDILIVKNDCITDSFTANLVFYDGQKWWTPDSPLLCGTKRAKLIHEKNISVCRITVNDLSKYQKVGLINALQDLKEMPVVDIRNVYS